MPDDLVRLLGATANKLRCPCQCVAQVTTDPSQYPPGCEKIQCLDETTNTVGETLCYPAEIKVETVQQFKKDKVAQKLVRSGALTTQTSRQVQVSGVGTQSVSERSLRQSGSGSAVAHVDVGGQVAVRAGGLIAGGCLCGRRRCLCVIIIIVWN